MLDGAKGLKDLAAPPANRLEKLRGEFADRKSIRLNDQHRIVFRFDGGLAVDVQITDYH